MKRKIKKLLKITTDIIEDEIYKIDEYYY